MDIFSYWRDQGFQSTMTKLAAENARRRREVRTKTVVYWTCLLGVLVLGLWKLYGGVM